MGQKCKCTIWDRTPLTYTSNLVYMCAGGFRGHKSSNRIEMSRFVQDLLNFCFGPWGGGRWVGGIWGHLGEWECHHMHAHACKCMYRNCKWPPTWRHPCLSCLTCMCMYVCMHVCMGYPSTHPYPPQPSSTHPPPP